MLDKSICKKPPKVSGTNVIRNGKGPWQSEVLTSGPWGFKVTFSTPALPTTCTQTEAHHSEVMETRMMTCSPQRFFLW